MQQPEDREVTSLYPNNIGVCIKKQGYTQEEVADAIGIARRTLSNYISGKRAIPRGYLEKIAQAIGCEIEELTLQSENQSTLSSQIKPTVPESFMLFPLPPYPYFAHPYALQQNFVGRVNERMMLTEWFTKPTQPILTLVAFGGTGKTALSWTWLQQDVMRLLENARPAGVLWWSFYESEASFMAFLNHALKYLSNGKMNASTIQSLHEKTQALINLLQQQRYLLVLDGFEYELRGYANSTHILQEEALSTDAHNDFRVCTDLYAGNFLRWLAAGTSKSKVLVNTRLFPRELDGLVGCQRVDLTDLDDEDAVNFFLAQGVQGTRTEILKVCRAYGNHPLALRLLTGLVVCDPD